MDLVQKKSAHDKLIPGIVTSAILLGIYATLHWSALPEVREKTQMYDEIDWTRFHPQPEEVAEPPQPVKLEKPTPAEDVAETPEPVQRVDLSSLENLQLESLSEPSPSLDKKSVTRKSPPAGASQNKIDLGNSGSLGGFDSLLGESSRSLSMSGRGRGNKPRPGSGLTVGSGAALESENGSDYGEGAFSLGAPETKGTDNQVADVPLMSAGDLADNFEDLSPIYRALIEWMKRHPAAFPEVVQRFMETAPSDLSSVVEFQTGGRQFTMYLICKPRLYEVRICLVEGGASTYLIDRGFKERSSYLRVGSVNRRGDGKIISFGTRRQAASNQRTREFYQIFLSWWEQVKPEVSEYL